MRTKAVAVLVLTLVSSVPFDAQQHALPAITPRTASTDASTLPPPAVTRTEPIVYLDALPLRDDSGQLTITEAARNNDYSSFESLYTAAKARGERVAQYDALHELWSWSMNNPTGAFYGPDLYGRFAAAYPGFADYIADSQIVDSRGNVFYPTAETRRFLLDHAVRGTNAPRVDIARSEPRAQPERATRRGETTPRATTSSPSVPRNTTHPRARLQKADATASTPAITKPSVTAAAPVAVATAVPASVPVQPVEAPAGKAVLATMVSPQPVVPVVKPAQQGAWGRGVLLLIIGIVGLGVLASILRAPKEQPLTIMPAEGAEPGGNVEPIRKPEAAPQQQQPSGKKSSANRANGSR